MTTNKLKTAGLLFAAAMLFSFFAPGGEAQAQTGLKVLWEKDDWGKQYHTRINKGMVRFSGDGKSLYFTADSSITDSNGYAKKLSKVYRISSETGDVISSSDNTKEIYSFDLSEFGNRYVTLLGNYDVHIYDAGSHKEFSSFNTNELTSIAIRLVAISPDGKYLVYNWGKYVLTDSAKHYLSIYDIEARKTIKEMPSIVCAEIRFAPDGKTFAVGGKTTKQVQYESVSFDEFVLYDATTWETKAVIAEVKGAISGFDYINYSSDSKLVAARQNNMNCIYNIETGLLKKFVTHPIYGYSGYNILMQKNNYVIFYNINNAGVSTKTHVFYNNDKEVNACPVDYYYRTNNNYEDNVKIFGVKDNKMAVLVPSTTGVTETPVSNISLKYTSDYLLITSSGIESQTAKIIISDLSGKEVYAGSVEIGNDNAQQIHAPLGIGAYLYQVIGQNKTYSGKFVVGK